MNPSTHINSYVTIITMYALVFYTKLSTVSSTALRMQLNLSEQSECSWLGNGGTGYKSVTDSGY